MYIEDLIIALAISRNVSMNPYDSKLIYSFHDQISRGSGFTEKQELLSVKILKRQIAKLNSVFGKDILPFLENPSFRLARRLVSSFKRIAMFEHPNFGKTIKLEFPFNESLLARIREEKPKMNMAQWDPEHKSWIFSLDERSLTFLGRVAIEENFIVDEEFENYQNQIKEIEASIEQYIPMLSYNGENLKFLNISEKIDQPVNSNIIENLFMARKLGIFTWDETIEETEGWKNADLSIKKFLQTDPGETFSINSEEHGIFSLKDIVKYMSPVLFVIPGGNEMEKLEKSLNFLKDCEISNEEISVLFRLPNETGEKFNNFIREEKLNSSISDKTKAVFISSKVPKTILDKKIKFNCVVNFNFYNIHYSIKNLLNWHHNVIHILDNNKQRTLDFGLLQNNY
jgi:hypothetical protein